MITAQLMKGNNCVGNSQAVNQVAKLDMDIKQIRVDRLRKLIADKYTSNGAFADAHGMKRPQVSRWLTSNLAARQGINEVSARAIEEKEGLPVGWLDRMEDQTAPPIDVLTVQVFPLRCPECGKVSHKSFIQLEMNDRLPCDHCGLVFNINDQYGNGELKMFLESIGRKGFILRQNREFD